MPETTLSKPALLADVPEIDDIKIKFVYNFFTADERVNGNSDKYGEGGFTSTRINLSNAAYTSNISTTNITDESLRKFYGRKSVFPRFIKITFASPRRGTTTPAASMASPTAEAMRAFGRGATTTVPFTTPTSFGEYGFSSAISRIDADKIYRETALNVFGRTGVSIVDTEIDKSAYNRLAGSATSQSGASSASPSQRIINAIKNSLQPNGYRYAATDAREGVSDAMKEKLQNLDFGFSYLSNTAGSITAVSLNSVKNIYVDEIASTQSRLDEIESQAITLDPYVINANDYEAFLNYVDIPVESSSQSNVLVGYIIQKFSRDVDGSTTLFEEIIKLDPRASSFLDPDIVYGSYYTYKILALYACKFVVTQETSEGDAGTTTDRNITKYALFASKGTSKSILCEELIAPPPPVDLSFRFSGDNTGLKITWNFPINLQLDIKKFQVFRRKSVSDPFQLIRVYDFDDSLIKTVSPENVPESLITRSLFSTTIHKDTEFTKNSRFIYAICAIDAHGLTSNYSVQLEASYDRYRNRINTRVISRSDSPKPYPNIFLNKDTFVDTMKMSGYTRLNIYFDPEYIQITNQDGVSQNHVAFAGTRIKGSDNSYKLMIVNTDFQQSQTLDIKINDSYVQPPVITPSTARVFSPT